MNTSTRLIVFDLDGTLVDSRKDLTISANAMLGELGAPPLPEAEIVRMVGEGARVLIERAVRASGLPAGVTSRALARFLEIYGEHLLDHTRPYAGVVDLLRRLQETGARMSVLTNKPAAASVRVLEGLGLSEYFDEVIGGDGPYPRKPDPAALLHLIDAAAATRDVTIMIGDSPIDLETARNARVRCCLVRYGFGFAFAAGELGDDVIVADTPAALATAF